MATNEQIIKEMTTILGIGEEVHTYQRWQALGQQVQKGSKALFACKIWRAYKGKKTEEVVAHRLVKASFFGASQCKPIAQIEDGNTVDVAAVDVTPAAYIGAKAQELAAPAETAGDFMQAQEPPRRARRASEKTPASYFNRVRQLMKSKKLHLYAQEAGTDVYISIGGHECHKVDRAAAINAGIDVADDAFRKVDSAKLFAGDKSKQEKLTSAGAGNFPGDGKYIKLVFPGGTQAAYVKEQWVKYFPKNCEFYGTGALKPVAVYQHGEQIGVIAPLRVPY